jgi:hypothetical protein
LKKTISKLRQIEDEIGEILPKKEKCEALVTVFVKVRMTEAYLRRFDGK